MHDIPVITEELDILITLIQQQLLNAVIHAFISIFTRHNITQLLAENKLVAD